MSTPLEIPESQPSPGSYLENGLHVRLVHRPDTALCAALMEVHGGSHDEPHAYPGLAHFLEHLVFLGSREFPAEQGLLPFVQGLGGRVNASTRAGSTRFFFEVPAAHLEQALARLVDMLANPLLDTTAVWREREVLQAEYSARARDPNTLCDAALAWALAPGHPLADFHAGKAASLDLDSPAFMPALRQFHRDHYQPARMSLTLVGPQGLDQLTELVARQAIRLQPGRHLPEAPVPPILPLRASRLCLGIPGGCQRLLLAFALELPGRDLEASLAFLDSLMKDESPGGLQARLGLLELSDGVQLRLTCAHGGQGLLVMDFERVEGADCAQLESEVLDWLDFLRARAPWSGLWDQRLKYMQRTCDNLEPLEAALAPGLPRQEDVRSLLQQLNSARLIRLETGELSQGPWLESAGFPLQLEMFADRPGLHASTTWQLPPPNPYLHPSISAPIAFPPVPILPGLPEAPGRSAIFLRWQPESGGLPQGLAHGLQRALRPVLGAASQAGVVGSLQAEQGGLVLELLGEAGPLGQVARDSLSILQSPPLWTLAQGARLQASERRRQTGELPIRQLLQRLPDLVEPVPAEVPAMLGPDALAGFWWRARRQGLGIGDLALDIELPGLPVAGRAVTSMTGRSWHRLAIEGEAALLLFYPVDRASADLEAAGRLLASVLEPAFHLRLRGELQLGYALACGFRQVGRTHGLLFAVQSPRASVAGLLGHIQGFLACQHERLARQDPTQLHDLVQRLDQQLLRQGTSFNSYARECWLDWQSGLGSNHRTLVRQALLELQAAQLQDLLGRMILGGSCLVLANADAPASGWHSLT